MKDRTVLALKGLAIIAVAFHHVSNRRLDPDVVDWVKIMLFCFHWCVLGFFLVSGYLQALSDSKKQRSLLEFTRVRVWRLIVPFVLFVLFYSCLWQIVQSFHVPNLAIKMPTDLIGKITNGLWPIHQEAQAGEQLYFFLLLFGVSMALVVVQKLLGIYGMWAAAVSAAVAGTIYFPENFTGFFWGVFVWGIGFYAGGYLLYHYRDRKTAVRIALLIATVLLIACDGHVGIIRCIPLWLLAEGATIGFDRIPLFQRLGEASGTIYVYHTPFLLQPLVIIATYLPGKFGQFFGIFLAVTVAIGLCYLLFESLKNTRAKVILM